MAEEEIQLDQCFCLLSAGLFWYNHFFLHFIASLLATTRLLFTLIGQHCRSCSDLLRVFINWYFKPLHVKFVSEILHFKEKTHCWRVTSLRHTVYTRYLYAFSLLTNRLCLRWFWINKNKVLELELLVVHRATPETDCCSKFISKKERKCFQWHWVKRHYFGNA